MSFFQKSAENSKILTPEVYGIILGVHVKFNLPDTNGCKNHGVHCPIASGTTYSFTYSLPVKTSYPQLKLIVEWRFIDDRGKRLMCIRFPAELK